MQFLKRSPIAACAIALALSLLAFAQPVAAQGVTTGSMAGVARDAQNAVVPGVNITVVHVPSGTTYEAVTQGDGRFFIENMRVGGPYKVTAALTGFNTEVQEGLTVSLGVTTDVAFSLKLSSVSETVTVVGKSDVVFSSSRTGAVTAVLREELASLPTVSGRINDISRLTPQYGGSGTPWVLAGFYTASGGVIPQPTIQPGDFCQTNPAPGDPACASASPYKCACVSGRCVCQ